MATYPGHTAEFQPESIDAMNEHENYPPSPSLSNVTST